MNCSPGFSEGTPTARVNTLPLVVFIHTAIFFNYFTQILHTPSQVQNSQSLKDFIQCTRAQDSVFLVWWYFWARGAGFFVFGWVNRVSTWVTYLRVAPEGTH